MLYVWNDDFDDDYINMYKASENLERSEFLHHCRTGRV